MEKSQKETINRRCEYCDIRLVITNEGPGILIAACPRCKREVIFRESKKRR